MMRATFSVSESCFAANMAVKYNAVELADKYWLAADASAIITLAQKVEFEWATLTAGNISWPARFKGSALDF